MYQRKDILDILARSMLGQITGEEQRLLDAWMEDPHNQKLMKDFLKRKDMLSIYSLPKSHSVMGNPFEQDNMSTSSLASTQWA